MPLFSLETATSAPRRFQGGRGAAFWNALASIRLTIACLAALIALVFACTLAQVRLGTFGAVQEYIRGFFVYWSPEGSGLCIPIFPGGGLLGLLLLANLSAAQAVRLEWSRRKLGLWIVHAGLILLFAGEFVTGLFQIDGHVAVEEGGSRAYAESPREFELALIDATQPGYDRVFAFGQGSLREGAALGAPGLPFELGIRKFYRNSAFERGGEALATAGDGVGIGVAALEPVSSDEFVDRASAFVALRERGGSGSELGTWLVSSGIERPQDFRHAGRLWRLALRPRRYPLGFSLALKDFRREMYPGTDIPRHFSSRVRVSDPEGSETRDALISMNQPLRHGGWTLYQSGFAKEDSVSILQAVRNPGWVLPYLACVLVGFGLLLHFGLRLRGSMRANA